MKRPDTRPADPRFSSGPTVKRPGWTPTALAGALTGRNHRSAAGQARIRHCLELMRRVLALPDDYLIAIVPGSDTGAMEMAMWSLLGAEGVGVDGFAFDTFGARWVADLRRLGLADLRCFEAAYGALPDLAAYRPGRDCVLTWNATAAGVMVPDTGWIDDNRTGLVIVDATSAVFALDLQWRKFDAVTFSWQKALGGEAAHGVIVLSPRAVARLESHTPPWPVPKLFTLTRDDGKLNRGIFEGATINTPSMLCVEDAIDALEWAESIGGMTGLRARVAENFAVIAGWMRGTGGGYFAYLAEDTRTISPVSVCLCPHAIADGESADGESADGETARAFINAMCALLESEGAGYDLRGHAAAPPGIRIWCGPTMDTANLTTLLPWLEWAYAETMRTR